VTGALPRILIIGTMTSPSGAPIAALRLAAGFAERGHPTEALFLYDRDGVEGGDHPYRCLLPRPPHGTGDFAAIWRGLRDAIRAFRPDAVLTFLPLASVLGAAAARAAGVPVRIVSHRVPRDTYSAPMRALDTLSAWAGDYTDVIAVSAQVGRSCAAYPGWLKQRVAVVYNGLKGFTPSPLDQAAARARLGLPAQAMLAVAVGRLDRQKNYPMLITAMQGADPAVHLAIAGEGADRDAIAAQIAALGLEQRVTLLGSLPRGDIPHLLAAADLFVQPSLFEGQSNALLEALHAGLPCYVSDAPEQIETVQGPDGAMAGAILPMHDSAAWRAALGRAAGLGDDPAVRAAIAERVQTFTFDRMMQGFADMVAQRL